LNLIHLEANKNNLLRPSFVVGTCDKTWILCFEKSGGWTSSPGREMVFLSAEKWNIFFPVLFLDHVTGLETGNYPRQSMK